MGYSEGLYPAQWTALRYLAKAPEGTRTASSLARVQGLASGPVSRTVRTLIQKDLVRKADHQPLGRAEHLELTAKGADLLDRDPLHCFSANLEMLEKDERVALAAALEAVIATASSLWPKNQNDPKPV